MSTISEYSDRVSDSEMPLLGSLLWYTVSDVMIAHDDVVRAMVKSGIATRLPSPPRDADVFERVSKAAEQRKVPTASPGIFENYLVRNVGRDDEKITRRIVVEQVDPAGRRLNYEQVADVEFHRNTSVVDFTYSTNTGRPEVTDMLVNIVKEYQAWRGHLNSYAVREWIRKFTLGLGATSVRPGVYFVMQDRMEEVEKLDTFVNSLPGGCAMHHLPLIDDTRQREMLRQAFETETNAEIDTMLSDMQDVFDKAQERGDSYKITESRYLDYLNRYSELTEKAEEYEGLLESSLQTTHSRLKMFQSTVMKLHQHVKA